MDRAIRRKPDFPLQNGVLSKFMLDFQCVKSGFAAAERFSGREKLNLIFCLQEVKSRSSPIQSTQHAFANSDIVQFVDDRSQKLKLSHLIIFGKFL